MLSVVISGHSGHYSYSPFFQGKMGSEGQVTPFDQNKEGKYISKLFTGRGKLPFPL